jgi:hypothetical protein
MHSYNTRYQAKLLQEYVALRIVKVPLRGVYTYRNNEISRVSKKIARMVQDPEADMMRLMKYVDKHPYILVVHQATREAIQLIIKDYTPKLAEFGRHLFDIHRVSKKASPMWEAVIEEMVQWLILKNMMESLESICK